MSNLAHVLTEVNDKGETQLHCTQRLDIVAIKRLRIA